MNKLLLVFAGVVLASFVVACGGDDDSGNSSASPTAAEPTTAGSPTAAADQPLFATALDFHFNPTELEVKAGVETTVKFNNSGGTTHTFTVDGVTDTGFVEPGDFVFQTFTIDKPGDYQFYCQIHGAATMSGTIHVIE
jgi:plastocyanin